MSRRALLCIALVMVWEAVLGYSGHCTGMDAAQFWGDRERGWFWYEEPPPIVEEEVLEYEIPLIVPSLPTPAPHAPVSNEPTYTERAKMFQEMVEEAQNRAILEPSEANVREYLQLQNAALDRSELFAKVFQRVVMSDPVLDYNRRHPYSNLGTQIEARGQLAAANKAIEYLATLGGFFFFYRSDCPYCHDGARILKHFAHRFGIEVSAVSADGGALPEFPNFKKDNGIGSNLGVSTYPTIYFCVPGATPGGQTLFLEVAVGLVTEDELVKRLIMVADQEKLLPLDLVPAQYRMDKIETDPGMIDNVVEAGYRKRRR